MAFDPRNLTPIELTALTIYGEARGEQIDGQVAVANVIKNRVADGEDYYTVILKPKQFSCWNRDDPNYLKLLEIGQGLLTYGPYVLKNDVPFIKCLVIATLSMSGLLVDNTFGSKYYMTKNLFDSSDRPHWANAPVSGADIGNHHFFNV